MRQASSLAHMRPRHGNQTMKKQKSKNQDDMQIIVEEIEKCRVDKNLSRITSSIHSIGRQESQSQNVAEVIPEQIAGSQQSPNYTQSIMEGTMNLLGSVNDRDEELSGGI